MLTSLQSLLKKGMFCMCISSYIFHSILLLFTYPLDTELHLQVSTTRSTPLHVCPSSIHLQWWIFLQLWNNASHSCGSLSAPHWWGRIAHKVSYIHCVAWSSPYGIDPNLMSPLCIYSWAMISSITYKIGTIGKRSLISILLMILQPAKHGQHKPNSNNTSNLANKEWGEWLLHPVCQPTIKVHESYSSWHWGVPQQ